MAKRGEIVISGSLDGAAPAPLTAAELDLVIDASPDADMLHLRDGRRVHQVGIGFPRDTAPSLPNSATPG